MIDDYLIRKDLSKVADLFRCFIIHNVGGVYLDFDQIVFEYDIALHKFDFISYTTDYHKKYKLIENSIIASAKNHPVPGIAVAQMINNHFAMKN